MGEGINADTVEAEGSPAWLGLFALLSVGILVAVGALGLHHVSRQTTTTSTDTPDLQAFDSAASLPPVPTAASFGALPTPPHAVAAGCQPGMVTFAGPHAVAKVRIAPDGEQVGYAPRGSQLVVCDVAVTPGQKTPNRWRRIYGGPHNGAWIHEEVLTLEHMPAH